ncbi:hypothetical protein [Streptomyces purpurascens]
MTKTPHAATRQIGQGAHVDLAVECRGTGDSERQGGADSGDRHGELLAVQDVSADAPVVGQPGVVCGQAAFAHPAGQSEQPQLRSRFRAGGQICPEVDLAALRRCGVLHVLQEQPLPQRDGPDHEAEHDERAGQEREVDGESDAHGDRREHAPARLHLAHGGHSDGALAPGDALVGRARGDVLELGILQVRDAGGAQGDAPHAGAGGAVDGLGHGLPERQPRDLGGLAQQHGGGEACRRPEVIARLLGQDVDEPLGAEGGQRCGRYLHERRQDDGGQETAASESEHPEKLAAFLVEASEASPAKVAQGKGGIGGQDSSCVQLPLIPIHGAEAQGAGCRINGTSCLPAGRGRRRTEAHNGRNCQACAPSCRTPCWKRSNGT